jgi:hypothetical protein
MKTPRASDQTTIPCRPSGALYFTLNGSSGGHRREERWSHWLHYFAAPRLSGWLVITFPSQTTLFASRDVTSQAWFGTLCEVRHLPAVEELIFPSPWSGWPGKRSLRGRD